ncbi:hypothetical protein QBC39DRAFT_378794 [Podospora conica]|nr:hypothetical protein QBC39DRAFT_378794 [Schizothecium conicum]
MPPPTYYEILSLPPSLLTTTTPSSSPSHHQQLLKRAYRRALLNHHPDKTKTNTTTTKPSTTTTTPRTATTKTTYTIDQITLAFTTLSTPSLRAAYDRDLALLTTAPQGEKHHTGLETVDLDDLSYDDDDGEWFRACRCGNPRGFRVGEEDLDEALLEQQQAGEGAGGAGEVVVGCVDCSLWLRVLFAVAVEEHEDEGEGEGGKGEGGKGEGAGERG